MIRKIILTLAILLNLLLISAKPVLAQDSLATKQEQFEAIVTKVIKVEEKEIFGNKQKIQHLKLEIATGKNKGQSIVVENGGLQLSNIQYYSENDQVIAAKIINPDGSANYFVLDYVRRDALYTLLLLFILVTALIARKKGLASLIGLVYSFAIIFGVILPQILQGNNPIIVALLGGLLIAPINFYISHGINRKTHMALLGTLIALFITGILAYIFIEGAHLTGFASEDASFLQAVSEGHINIKGLLLAGIIISLLGILDDITISQAAIVFKLRETSPHLSSKDIYLKAMDIGKDHIGSLINTLILVYAGASLPFLLLLISNNQSFQTAINYEVIAEEIVRTLTASIGLILAVPITTLLAALHKK